MFDHLISFIDPSSLSSWLPIVPGFLTAALIVLAGRWLGAKSTQSAGVRQGPGDPFLLCVTERRSCARRQGDAVLVVVAGASGNKGTAQGWVVDRSLGGLGLAVPMRLHAGDRLHVRRAQGGTSSTWVQLHIKHCRRQEKSWLLGGELAGASCSSLLFNRARRLRLDFPSGSPLAPVCWGHRPYDRGSPGGTLDVRSSRQHAPA